MPPVSMLAQSPRLPRRWPPAGASVLDRLIAGRVEIDPGRVDGSADQASVPAAVLTFEYRRRLEAYGHSIGGLNLASP